MSSVEKIRNVFEKRTLGRSGLVVGPLGMGSSYGAPAAAYEMGFEQGGLNYFYWGSLRKNGLRDAVRNLAPRHRDKMVVAIQTYTRFSWYLPFSITHGLKQLKIDYADVLLLGWYDKPPKPKILDAVRSLKEKGLVRKVAISCHNRPLFQEYMKDPFYDLIMVRYNAAHRGAEKEVFPFLEKFHTRSERPGVMTYTTTRWGDLINPKNTPAGLKTPKAMDCYRFALTNPAVDMTMCAPSSLDEMKENLKALELGPMNSEELAWMKKIGDNVRANTGFKPFPDN